MKNKTLAVWLTLFLGPTGLHRIYLLGKYDGISTALLVPSVIGLYGVARARELGVNDQLSWLLIPFVGFTMSACALTAIVYGLMDTDQWNRRFNPGQAADTAAGQTNWLTVGGLAIALLLGATVLLSSIAFSFQRYFEYQYEQGQASSIQGQIQGSSPA